MGTHSESTECGNAKREPHKGGATSSMSMSNDPRIYQLAGVSHREGKSEATITTLGQWGAFRERESCQCLVPSAGSLGLRSARDLVGRMLLWGPCVELIGC